MAVTIVDRRTIITEADDFSTGWTNGDRDVTDNYAEGISAVGDSIPIGDQAQYYTTASAIDMSDKLVYVYSFNNALQNNWDNTIPPNGLLIGDGTNIIGFHMAGQDRRVFNHLEGPTNWQCLVLDGAVASQMDTDGHTYESSGSFANLDPTAIEDFGCYHQTLSKALGGGYNVGVDIIRVGNNGIYVTAGGTGTEGTCSQLASEDRSTANQAGHGIFRELAPVAFGCQGPLTFGRADSATDCHFKDTGVSIIFEDWDIADGKYYFNITGHASATNRFELTTSTITTGGPSVSMTCGDNIDYLMLDAVSFVDWKEPIAFPTDSNASHDVQNCVFSNCGQIDPGTINFVSNIISGYNASYDTNNGAVLIDSNASVEKWSGLSFTSNGTGHAIYLTQTGSFTFSNYTYSGYAGTDGDTGNEVLYNNSGGSATITISGGDSPTVRNGAGSSTTLVTGTVTVKAIVQTAGGTKIQNANTFLYANTGGPFPAEDSVTITNTGTTASVEHTGHGLSTGDKVWIYGGNIQANVGVFTITLINANNYSYTMGSSPGASPTGDISSTFVFLKGLTDVNGEIELERVVTSTQPILGWARKSTSSPLYKQGPISGDVSSSENTTFTAILSPDE